MTIDAQRIETMLAERGLTRKELAASCGISRQNVSTIIRRGTCEPKTAGKLAAGLGVSVADIIKKDVSHAIEQERIQPAQTPEKRIPTDPRISAEDLGFCICTKCGSGISRKWNYCPHCGAAVQGGHHAGKPESNPQGGGRDGSE